MTIVSILSSLLFWTFVSVVVGLSLVLFAPTTKLKLVGICVCVLALSLVTAASYPYPGFFFVALTLLVAVTILFSNGGTEAKDKYKRTKSGFPLDPKINSLELKLATLAYQWRGCNRRNQGGCDGYVREYLATMEELKSLGWLDRLGADSELPDELMPDWYLNQ